MIVIYRYVSDQLFVAETPSFTAFQPNVNPFQGVNTGLLHDTGCILTTMARKTMTKYHYSLNSIYFLEEIAFVFEQVLTIQ